MKYDDITFLSAGGLLDCMLNSPEGTKCSEFKKSMRRELEKLEKYEWRGALLNPNPDEWELDQWPDEREPLLCFLELGDKKGYALGHVEIEESVRTFVFPFDSTGLKVLAWRYVEHFIPPFEFDKALEKYSYRWHDLTKYPEDLPEELEDVLVLHEYWHYKAEKMDAEYETGYYARGIWCGAAGQGKDNKVIAWRYIEPFEV